MTLPDICILTARDQRQARLFEERLRALVSGGQLPRDAQWIVTPDPAGPPLGTGGATLHALCVAAGLTGAEGFEGGCFRRRRVFLIHCGGLSQRLPQFAQLGKVFAPLPDHRGLPTPLLVQVFESLSSLASAVDEGVFVACGDVLYRCSASEVRLRGADAAVLVCPAPPEQATCHGVYGWDRAAGLATQVVQKPTESQLAAAGLLDRGGMASLDTGIVYLSPQVAEAWIGLLPRGAASATPRERFLSARERWSGVEFYRDVTGAMVPGAAVTDAGLVGALGGFRLRVLSPRSGEFLHFGTTRELIRMLCGAHFRHPGPALGARVGPDVQVLADSLLQASILEGAGSFLGSHSVVHFSEMKARLELPGYNYVHGARSPVAVRLPENSILYQAPIRSGESRAEALVALGLSDNPKLGLTSGATFLGEEMRDWLDRRNVDHAEVWPDRNVVDSTLWNARLFPAGPAEDVYTALPWLLEGGSRESETAWRSRPRRSMAQIAASFDVARWRGYERDLLSRLLAREISDRLAAGTGSYELLAATAALGLDRPVASRLEAEARRNAAPLVAAKLWQYCASLARTDASDVNPVVEGSSSAARCQRRAFANVGAAVQGARRNAAPAGKWSAGVGAQFEATAPVRVDLAGGWTDTPPQALELGGLVLNVALELNGDRPIRTRVEIIPEPHIHFIARDLDRELTVADLRSLRDHADPSKPFSLHKAALFEAGAVPDRIRDLAGYLASRGGGLRIETESAVPKGSGLGTSSILGATVLAALAAVIGGPEPDAAALSAGVLRLEQRLTTGGGWQDQVGAITGGFKFASTCPGQEQAPQIEVLDLPPDVLAEFESRLVVFYTGVPRLARNVLQRVVARYLLQEPAAVEALAEMRRVAVRLRSALMAGDLDEVGACLSHSWELNKQIEPSGSNPEIDHLFAAIAPYSAGAKLAGAGGGGFLLALARDRSMTGRLHEALVRAGAPKDGAFCATVSHRGLATDRLR